MVEYNQLLNKAYASLSDPTRRDILFRVSHQELSVSTLAEPYNMSFAAVAKHITVLETAQLVYKRQLGKQQLVKASPKMIKLLKSDLEKYEQLWRDRFATLDEVLKNTK